MDEVPLDDAGSSFVLVSKVYIGLCETKTVLQERKPRSGNLLDTESSHRTTSG